MSGRKLLEELDSSTVEKFSQFPLSEPTRRGLKSSSYFKPTSVQKKSLKHTLLGKDVIVQAKTGSGKTLAYVIPVLEYIYTEKISSFDGPIAIVLTPTRELAKQVFAVFQRVGKFHNFTMIDIMGGKTNTGKREEWRRAANANIIIGTPGRFAQHQRQNPSLDLSNLHFLILDEVDRLLDPTFRSELIFIVNNLSSNRHSMLFSATFSKCDLSALGLKSPVMISTESSNIGATPVGLKQGYFVVPLGKKLDHLWTFLQSHCKKKIIVFFSTQKQVRFVHDLFTQMRPYFSLMQLRGNMLQSKRFKIYEKFSQTPRGAVLFATNIAERGLDFPEVDWVVQFDCPKQLDDYIHRVGRTARAERRGRALMFLLPSEVGIIKLLSERNIQIRQMQIPESLAYTVVTTRAPAILASKPELAESGRIAFCAYLRDYCFIPKSLTSSGENHQTSEECAGMSLVFKPGELPVDEFAASLGLALVPELPKEILKYRPENAKKARKPTLLLAKDMCQVEDLNGSHSDEDVDKVDDNEDGDFLKRKAFSVVQPEIMAKVEATGKKLLEVVPSSDDDESGSDEGEKMDGVGKPSEPELPIKESKKRPLTRIQQAKKELKRKIVTHTRVEYDAEGKPIAKYVGGVRIDDLDVDEGSTLPPARLDIEAEREKLRSVIDIEDKARWREQIRAKHRLERNKAKEVRKAEQAAKSVCQLASGDGDEDNGSSVNSSHDSRHSTCSNDNSDNEIRDEDMGDLEYCEESAENDEIEEEEEEPVQKRSRKN
nr:ATP dependent RNA helicase DDX10 [Hymenolepis microstoma]